MGLDKRGDFKGLGGRGGAPEEFLSIREAQGESELLRQDLPRPLEPPGARSCLAVLKALGGTSS